MRMTNTEPFKRIIGLFYSVVERPEMTLEERRRRTVVLLLMLVAIPTLFTFGAVHFIHGSLVRSAALFLVGLVCVFSLILLRYRENASPVFRIIVGVLGSYFLVLVVIGGTHGSRIFWMLLFPLLAFFLLARLEGLAWSLVSFFLCLFLLSDPHSIFGTYPYEAEIKMRLSGPTA